MLTDQEIEQLAADLESDRVERKESLSGSAKDKIAQAICAYCNDLPSYRAPGLILVGVSDDGEPTGLPITDELLVNLGAIRSDGNILPIPTMAVRKVVLRGQVVEKRQSGDLPFDRRGVRGASLDDLDLDFFRSSYLPSAVSQEVLASWSRARREAGHRTSDHGAWQSRLPSHLAQG